MKTKIEIVLVTEEKWNVKTHEKLLRDLSKRFKTSDLQINSKPL